MKKQNDLQWFLIKKFIEILAVVGVVEYLLTFLVNRFVLPNVLLYFFPGVEENPLLLGSGVIFFLSAVLMLLILGALNAMFPSPLHEMVQAALEQMQKNFMHTVSAGKTNFSFYELNRGQAILLFLVAFVVVLVILTPYVSGAVCFAKITIKEFRQIQREREEEQKEFDRKRNLMLSDIAHDLRTPMTTVNGYAKALADGMVVEPEKQLEYLQAIQNKSARMNDLIHLLFEYVKLDSEGFSLDRKETDLSELLRENAALIYADFEDAGMEFEIDIPEEVVSVSVDPIQFSRVITNLLNNAMKHNESGTHIKIGMYRKNGYIYILVADSGRRIPENGYGIAKLCAGQMSRILCEQKQIEHIWTRILSIYGPYDGENTMIMSSIGKLLRGEKPALTKGEQQWDYLYSKDAGYAMYLLGEKGVSGKVYCIGSGKTRCLAEYVKVLRDSISTELPLGFGEIAYAPKQVMHLCADISDLTNDTGFIPQYSFEEGIKETIEWYKGR